jgi:hypothetical protein
VILGCTHFPFYQEGIEGSFDRLRELRTASGEAPYKNLIADDLVFVDPAQLTAVQLHEELADRHLLVGQRGGESSAVGEFYISVANTDCPGAVLRPDGLSFTYDYKYGRNPGELEKEFVKRVPMSRENLGTATVETIHTTMPAVWDRLVAFSAHSPRCEGLPEEARVRVGD